ncbi:glycerophosphodiester phosphodiesterase family protein [Mucilaginibacter sp. KACC 22063]|uniref:glycerophosphodiester phosphodiesterase family protein n=1 Tax=Mucilaginibacter sp. KACC 22063 TaxID=3025666 RepID=UPI002365D153|nr:glycerophosphodiester phosphodiesterase family protein [Mucilaginibacter sp. KACC 22063]WDF55236.1 glycerophosphodiester phosphodiesterase family protein [Mucilaginibacter sp. KACC 22063]
MKITLLLSFICFSTGVTLAQPNPLPKPRHAFTVVAHRGDHVKYPENSLAAYAEGIKNGVDYVEIDLRTTKDSVLVSMHDGSVTRMTGATGNIRDLTLAQVKQLRLKSRDTSDTTVYHVPTFEEILNLCKDKIYIYLDFKEASVAATYAMLRKHHMEKQVIVYINSEQQLTDWKHVAPHMPLMLSLPENEKDLAAIKAFIDLHHPDLLDGNWKDYNKEILTYLQEKHLLAWPDIQSADEDKNWKAALGLGFHGLQTDHPAALINYLEEKRIR